MDSFSFQISARSEHARRSSLSTPHGEVQLPCFMPVGTHGAVKGVSSDELRKVGSQIVLGNTYHLHLRPGEDTIAALGGLQQATTWNGPMLTDSGGFQVFSLGERGMAGNEKQAMRRVSEEGVTFSSHLDGHKELLMPEKSIQIQQKLGADIIMAFDQPVYGLSDVKSAEVAMERSLRWLTRCVDTWKQGDTTKQALFGIVQGGVHTELHTRSATEVVKHNLPGYAIGGLSVGESKQQMWEAVESIVRFLPEDRPRYFMGLGDPYDCMNAVWRGIDMFDCVSPTRIARHGAYWEIQADPEVVTAFWEGNAEELVRIGRSFRFTRERIALAANKHRTDTLSSGVSDLSVGMLCHYQHSGEALGWRVLSLHNIAMLHAVTQIAGRVELAAEIRNLLTD